MPARRSILGAKKRSRRWPRGWAVVALTLLLGGSNQVAAGGEHSGEVTFGGLPVPGVTVTAASGDRQLVTTTDERGRFQLPDASAGVWTIRVEMLGFETLTREVTVAAAPQPSTWTLTLKSFDDIARGAAAAPPSAANAQTLPGSTSSAVPASQPPAFQSPAAGARGKSGFHRATATSAPGPVNPRTAADESTTDPDAGASDGFLINGSVNNGAASPFAQG